ncbi:MAG: ABC transporter permease [Myxococcales bacterium]|nr:ABC transporter permease [Myxococcales bacterium]MDH3842404.1 ABC transporter permease [Myxococcales bacterium]
MMLLPVWAVIRRDLVRMVRQRGRLLSAFVRPLIWFVVIGSGIGVLLEPAGPGAYHRYLVPGVVAMTILFGSMLVALSVVYDKEFGVMRLLITAPLPHYWIVLAKIVSGVVTALVQAGVLLLFFFIFGFVTEQTSVSLLLAGLVGTALTCATLGMLVAVWTSTLDNFAVVMNFVIFPVFFLSGALYPVKGLPDALRLVAMINPFTYGVDLLKHAILGVEAPIAGADFGVATDIAVLCGFTLLAGFIACLRFSHEERAGLHEFLRGRK